jgi:hypothetical protein
MSAPICTDCGQPITAQHYDLMCDGTARHELLRECLGVLKRALSAAEADRDRYRAVLVALRDADRARNAATDAVDGTLDGPRTNWRRYEETIDVERRAIAARRDAIAAAIAAVEEGR